MANYVREDGAVDFTADDRVRWLLTARQREICEAVLRLGVSPIAAGRQREKILTLLKVHVYARLHVVLSASSATGNRHQEPTPEQVEAMRAFGVVGEMPLYWDAGLFFGSQYIDTVMAVTGAGEEEVWNAVGLLPYNRFGLNTTRNLRPRTRKAARTR